MLVTLHVMVCLVLVLVIMLQSGNAADLAGAFGGAGSQTAFGPRGAATFLSKATTWCAIVFMVTSLTLSIKRTPTGAATSGTRSVLEDTTKTAPAAPPAKPAAAPARPVPQVSRHRRRRLRRLRRRQQAARADASSEIAASATIRFSPLLAEVAELADAPS